MIYAFPSPTPEELQETRSEFYVNAARVLQASTGRLLVFSMARGDCIAACSTQQELEAAVLAAIQKSKADYASGKIREQQQREDADRKGPATASVDKSAVDLGL